MLSSAVSNFTTIPFSNLSRQPRAVVLVNDIPVLWEDIQVQTTTFFIADNYSVTLPLNQQNQLLNLNTWSSVTDVTVKIYIGFPPSGSVYTASDLELFMVGTVDLMEINPLTARVVLSGRDFTSKLIDTKITKIYPNQTASNIAISLANKHGLNPIVTPTTGNIGRFLKNIATNSQNFITKQITEWDLITFLAQQSGYVVYVEGLDLHFEPFPTDTETSYVLNYTPPSFGSSPKFYGMDLRFKRSLTLANDVVVKVTVPTNPQTGKSFIKTATYVRRPRGTRGLPPPSGTKQTYNFIMAGLTPEQAQQQANTLAKNITLHEIVITASIPGDNILKKNSLLRINGTNTAFDQIYYTDTVTRQINVDAGYTMMIVAKNHSTDSELQI